MIIDPTQKLVLTLGLGLPWLLITLVLFNALEPPVQRWRRYASVAKILIWPMSIPIYYLIEAIRMVGEMLISIWNRWLKP